MRPPMTATKNDGISPPHWKTVLVQQKEVLAENKKFSSQLPTTSTPLLQSQSHHQLFEKHNDIQKSSSLLNDKLNGDDDDDDDFNDLSKLLDNSCDYNSSASSKLSNTQGLTTTISAKPLIASATTAAATTTIPTTTTKVSDDENFPNVVDSSKLLNDCISEQKIVYNKNLNSSKYSQQQQQQNNIIHNSTKLKRISSDVSDRRDQIKPQQTVSRNSSSSSLISFRTTNNSYNLYNNNTTSNLNNIYNNKNLNNISNSQSNNLKNNIILSNNKKFNSTEVPNNTKNNLITNTFEQFQNFPNSTTTTITKLITNPSSISSISSPSSSSFSSIQTINNTNPITSLTPTPIIAVAPTTTTVTASASDTTPPPSSITTTTTTTTTTVIETFTSSSLPLSETEPLLTNIDETKNIIDSKRSICLNKNSASLIFTKKELPTTAIVSSCKNNTINNCCNISNGSNINCISNINDLTVTTNTKINSKNNNSNNNNYSLITTAATTTTSNNKQNKSNNFLNSSNIVHLRTTISGANHNINNINYNNCNSSINNKQNNIIATNNLIKQQQQQQQQQNNHHQNFDDLLQNTCDGGVSDTDNLLLQRRRSLQLNYSSICRETIGNIRQNSTTTAATNRKQHAYSWYAPVYSALEEEIEQDSRDSSPIHNLASIKNKNDLENETVSLLDKNQINVQPQLHQPRIRRTVNPPNTIGIISGQIHNKNQNDSEGPQVPSQLLGGPMPRRKRIENFFKSLVGRKPSKEPINSTINASSSSTSNLTNSNLNANATTTTAIPNNNPPILQSPEITITRTPSEQNLQREIGGSTTSLNTVQQKLWNVVPLLKRDGQGSTASLHHHQEHKADSIVHYNGMRKCETVLALSRQSSSGNSVIGNGSIIGVGNGGNVGGVEQIRPLNRLRNSLSTSNATCSRCSSLLSLAASGSRYSLNVANTGFITVNNANSLTDSKTNIATTTGSAIVTIKDTNNDGSSNGIIVGGIDVSDGNENMSGRIENGDSNNMINTTTVSQQLISNLESITCKLCLTDVKMNAVTTIVQCGCSFCSECMTAYVEFEISEGAYEISCPDAQCPFQGIITLAEISTLASSNLMKKHHRYRLNREIELDKNRTWCPRAGCETVCHVGGETCGGSTSATTSSMSPTVSSSLNDDKVNSIIQVLCAVQCPTCREEFCSGCKKPWHPNISCDENNRRLIADGQESRVGIPFDNDLIKCCPMCAVPIEKDEGCAQMMCKRCKHVFCWYCLASLDDDFLLRHYDKGPCKNKLGHSRASVVWHRAQVIGIFAGFGILLLVASPLLLLAAPCIICCKCRICSGAAKLEDADTEFDEAVALQR